ncbi:hypothetical protein [Actinomyces faecalis]|nr:hypothetical protein [Actinomyces faecalis]
MPYDVSTHVLIRGARRLRVEARRHDMEVRLQTKPAPTSHDLPHT